jgi:hypothetical protein
VIPVDPRVDDRDYHVFATVSDGATGSPKLGGLSVRNRVVQSEDLPRAVIKDRRDALDRGELLNAIPGQRQASSVVEVGGAAKLLDRDPSGADLEVLIDRRGEIFVGSSLDDRALIRRDL